MHLESNNYFNAHSVLCSPFLHLVLNLLNGQDTFINTKPHQFILHNTNTTCCEKLQFFKCYVLIYRLFSFQHNLFIVLFVT